MNYCLYSFALQQIMLSLKSEVIPNDITERISPSPYWLTSSTTLNVATNETKCPAHIESDSAKADSGSMRIPAGALSIMASSLVYSSGIAKDRSPLPVPGTR
jgi:hypothetical protein